MRDSYTEADVLARSFPLLLISLSLIYLLIEVPLLDRVPLIAIDEAWYGNTAHNLASGHGLINTNVGERGGDQFFLYALVLSAAFKLCGTSLWVGRLVSVLLGVITLVGWGFVCRALAVHLSSFILTSALFITSNVYFIVFRRLRPEALVIALSVWAVYFLLRAWKTCHFRDFFLCALLVGGSACAHPNGTLLAVLLGLLIAARALQERAIVRPALGYATGGLVIILLFSLGWGLLRQQPIFDFLKADLLASHRVSTTPSHLLGVVETNLSTFVPTYSLGFKRLYILLFEFGVLLIGLGRYRHDRQAALLSLVGLIWFAAAVTFFTPFYRWAFGTVILFSLAVTARLLSVAVVSLSSRVRKVIWLMAFFYGLNNVIGDAYVVKHNLSNTAYSRLTETLRTFVPDGVPVFIPIQLWFGFQSNEVYTPFTRTFANPHGSIIRLLKSGHIRYVVLSATLSEGLSPITGQKDYSAYESNVRYERLYQQAHAEVDNHYRRVAVVPTHGYGKIEIWEYPTMP